MFKEIIKKINRAKNKLLRKWEPSLEDCIQTSNLSYSIPQILPSPNQVFSTPLAQQPADSFSFNKYGTCILVGVALVCSVAIGIFAPPIGVILGCISATSAFMAILLHDKNSMSDRIYHHSYLDETSPIYINDIPSTYDSIVENDLPTYEEAVRYSNSNNHRTAESTKQGASFVSGSVS